MRDKNILMGTVAIIVGILQLSALNAEAQTTIRVPSDVATIQGAIDAAIDGDSVLVAPGVYVENIDFQAKTITVESEQGLDITVIDGGGNATVAVFSSGEGRGTVLRGFTITNGRGSEGGGIAIFSASPTIEGNLVINNVACAGAGIALGFASPLIRGNEIVANRKEGCTGGIGGGGISIRGASTPEILDNLIADNVSSDGAGISMFAAGDPIIRDNEIRGNQASARGATTRGGAMWLVNRSDALIEQNLIYDNSADEGGGIWWLVPSGARGPRLVNNTIVDNDSVQGSGIFADGFDAQTELINNIVVAMADQTAVLCEGFNDLNPPMFTSNNIFSSSGLAYDGICADQTGINDNISADPLFVDPANRDFHLQAGSPAIDAGDNMASGLPDKDFDGHPRILDGDDNRVAVVDMGVDEFTPVTPFAAFDARVVLLRDVFFASGSFTLGEQSDSIDPVAEQLGFSLADTDGVFFDQSLPPGSFRQIGRTSLFQAPSGSTGIRLMVITPTNNEGRFTFVVLGRSSDLSGANNPPVTVSLQIRNDAGSKTISCQRLPNALTCR